MKPRLKMGMVGGGREATIGVIHEMAARLDGKIESWLAHFPRTPKDRS